MKSFFDKLNLRPQERRLVVFVGMVIFVLLNWWFVWPYFDDWSQVSASIDKNRGTLERYQREIGNRPRYEARQRELEATGSEMLAGELDLQRVIQNQASGAGVQLGRMTRVSQTVRTNQFFQEGAFAIEFNSGGKEIVDFLIGIAAQNAMVRVRDMSIRTDPPGHRLVGTMILVGNYQRPSTNSAPSKVAAASKTVAATKR